MSATIEELELAVKTFRDLLNKEARLRRREAKGRLLAEAAVSRALYYLHRNDPAAATRELNALPKKPKDEPDEA